MNVKIYINGINARIFVIINNQKIDNKQNK